MGKEGQTVPAMEEDWIYTISQRYIELYEKVIGTSFHPEPISDEEVKQRIENWIGTLSI
jgi:phosphoribosylaminoimidazole-succinocarboxamide synthase